MRPPPGAAPLAWTLPDGLRCAFSSADDGDLRAAPERLRWLAAAGVPHPCAVARQVHGVEVLAVAEAAHVEDPPVADALVTAGTGLALGVFGADCPGLVLAAPDALGVAHCGWRGTAGGLAARLAQALARQSRHHPRCWLAFIGPGIAGRNYEIDAQVLKARPWPAQALTWTGQRRARLDLATVLAWDCREAGITRVVACGIDTASDARLHSYRRSGKGPIQLLVAWRS